MRVDVDPQWTDSMDRFGRRKSLEVGGVDAERVMAAAADLYDHEYRSGLALIPRRRGEGIAAESGRALLQRQSRDSVVSVPPHRIQLPVSAVAARGPNQLERRCKSSCVHIVGAVEQK